MIHAVTRYATARAIIVTAAMFILAAGASAVLAQTLTQPNPVTRSPPPRPDAAKPQRAARTKPCSMFGAGFVNVPGTDACIKIGGSAETDVGR